MQTKFPHKKNILTEADWIESESINQLAQKVLGTQPQAVLATVFLFGLLYQRTSEQVWLLWLIFHVTVLLLRIWYVSGYHIRKISDGSDSPIAFYLRNIYIVALIGFAWGSTIFLYNDKEPSLTEAVCFCFVLIYGVTSTIYLSSHLKSLNNFVFGLCAGMVVSTILRASLATTLAVTTGNILLFLTCLLLTLVLIKFGSQLNYSYINALELQYRNAELIKNLTKEKQTALDAVATKNRMLASAAHDMRQPVLALDLYAGWLAEDPTVSAEIAPKITASTKAVVNLFDSLFDMSRLTEGQISTRLEAVNLNDVMSALYVQYQPIAKSKNLTLRMRAVQQSTVFTDYLLLERILGNLLNNAIKYTQTGGVLLACRKSSRGVKIEVWDTGVGISQDQQALVFKEFYKSPSNAGTSDGFGLGLAIVSQLVDLIGAELTLRSRCGRGTVVSVQLGQII